MSNNEFSHEGAELRNDDARAVEQLPIAGIRAVTRKHPMIPVSDMEINLRLNVPDGLETSGEWPYKYVTQEIDSHADSNASAIRKDDPSA
jgi:hypothetical protein